MPALSLPEDKPKIVFHSVMMAAQNLGFMIFYWDIWGRDPGTLDQPYINNTIIEDPCLDTRYAVGMMAITCFLVTFLEIGFAMGGYIDDTATFFFYWILHLIGGLGFYTQCTITIPLAMFADNSDDWVTKSKCGGHELCQFRAPPRRLRDARRLLHHLRGRNARDYVVQLCQAYFLQLQEAHSQG